MPAFVSPNRKKARTAIRVSLVVKQWTENPRSRVRFPHSKVCLVNTNTISITSHFLSTELSKLKAIAKSAPGTLSGMKVLRETFERDRNGRSGVKHIQQNKTHSVY